jgi:hypothetical protein
VARGGTRANEFFQLVKNGWIMGIFLSRPESKVVPYVWSCVDIIHEIMDYVYLKDISSISRIHRGSSTAIFTYHFKKYHPCKYTSFSSDVFNYNLVHYRRKLSIVNNYDRLRGLTFDSIILDSFSKNGLGFCLWRCLSHCLCLEIKDAEIFCEIQREWKLTNIKSALRSLSIREGYRNDNNSKLLPDMRDVLEIDQSVFECVNELAIHSLSVHNIINVSEGLRKISIGYLWGNNGVIRFPKTLESLTISLMFSDVRFDFSLALH